MPAFAPAATVCAERVRGQSARDAHHAGLVTLAGRAYACEIHLGAVKPEMDASTGNVDLAQRGFCVIRKSLLTAAPARAAILTHLAIDYVVAEVDGRDAHDPAWKIHFYRLPPQP